MSVNDEGCFGQVVCVAHQTPTKTLLLASVPHLQKELKMPAPHDPQATRSIVSCQTWLEMLSVAQGASLEMLPGQGTPAVWAGKLVFRVREG